MFLLLSLFSSLLFPILSAPIFGRITIRPLTLLDTTPSINEKMQSSFFSFVFSKHHNCSLLASCLLPQKKELSIDTFTIMLGRSLATVSKRSTFLRSIPRRTLCAAFTPNHALANKNHNVPLMSPQPRMQFSSAVAAVEHDEPSKTAEPAAPSFIPTAERKYEFFQNVEVNPDGIAIVRFDGPKKVNTISFKLKDEAETLWNSEIHNNADVKGVVFTSGKPDNFIAGADIFDIQAMENKEELIPLIESATDFFQHLKSKGVPLVCAINGPALGGGLEWALWCDYRICTDSPKTKMGLPEVKLGLLPGFGGTQNLFKLVGLQKAMDMMLTGKDIRPKQAKRMGLVDLVVAPQSLELVAIDTAKNLANGILKKRKGKKKSLQDRLVEDTSLGRHFMWQTIDKMVQKNTNGMYPAPFAIIDAVKYGIEHPQGEEKFKFERESFAKLAATTESEALIGIFDGMTKLKKHSYGKVAHPIDKVAVLGGGLMGSGIAQVTAEKGYEVLLKDRDDASVARGLSYIEDNWGKKLKRKRMSKFQYNINSSNIVPLTDDMESWKEHFGRADLVIEAVFEDVNLKRKIVAEMEGLTPDHCVFATNTSAIPIADIAAGAKRPEQIIGMHYFSPVPQMPLLEIIPHENTSDSTKAAAFEVGVKQGKTCIEVKDVPGFYVNRCLGPFLVEVSQFSCKYFNSKVCFPLILTPLLLLLMTGIGTCKRWRWTRRT